MSASSSDRRNLLGAALLAFLMAGCVTSAEQVSSQSDIAWFARALDPDAFAHLNPERLQNEVTQIVATPIEFYGRVTSDAGNPLKGARVTAYVFDRPVDPFEFPYFAFTERPAVFSDDSGLFSFTEERGAGLYIAVEVPGWAPVTTARNLYVYAPVLGETPGLPTPTEPADFVFEQRPPEADLKPIHTGALRFETDGSPLEVSLREVAPYGVEPGTGEAIIKCARTLENAAPSARFDWWCELTIPGGGLQPFNITMQRAPESGYVETDRLSYSAEDPDWDDRADRDLLIRFADGKYAYVTVSMRMDGDFYVAFDGVWNPTGSTWLD